MEQQLAAWWSMVSAYLVAPGSLFGGEISALLPLFGLACLAGGLVLAIASREKQALWLLAPFAAAALTPIVLTIAHNVLGWLGLGFALVLGFVALLVWTAVIAADATRRLPVWLIGLSLLSFVAYCGFLSVIIIWGAG